MGSLYLVLHCQNSHILPSLLGRGQCGKEEVRTGWSKIVNGIEGHHGINRLDQHFYNMTYSPDQFVSKKLIGTAHLVLIEASRRINLELLS